MTCLSGFIFCFVWDPNWTKEIKKFKYLFHSFTRVKKQNIDFLNTSKTLMLNVRLGNIFSKSKVKSFFSNSRLQ